MLLSIVLLGLAMGLLSAGRWTDLAYSTVIAGLAGLLLYRYMTDIVAWQNPPYCWGDVFAEKEFEATRKPTLSDVLKPTLAGAAAIYAGAFGAAILAKRALRRWTSRNVAGN